MAPAARLPCQASRSSSKFLGRLVAIGGFALQTLADDVAEVLRERTVVLGNGLGAFLGTADQARQSAFSVVRHLAGEQFVKDQARR